MKPGAVESVQSAVLRLQAGTVDISAALPGFTAVHVLSPQEAAALLAERNELLALVRGVRNCSVMPGEFKARADKVLA